MRLHVVSDSVSFLELIHTPAGINQLLPAREEGVALAADIHFQRIDVLGRTRLERFAACADDRYLVILGMNVLLHFSHLA